MAVVLGTNCGFVTVSPSADPAGSNSLMSLKSRAMKDTSPATAAKIVEIGWWCDNATDESNFEVGVYDHNVGDDEPENLLAGASQTNAKGTGAGWKKVTGLNISISSSTIYWIGVELDTTAPPDASTNYTSDAARNARKENQTTLTDPWGTSSGFSSSLYAIYAVWEAAPVNAWKAVAGAQINIGDVWKTISAMQINIGDAWKAITVTDLQIVK